jgi:hypothetical protein
MHAQHFASVPYIASVALRVFVMSHAERMQAVRMCDVQLRFQHTRSLRRPVYVFSVDNASCTHVQRAAQVLTYQIIAQACLLVNRRQVFSVGNAPVSMGATFAGCNWAHARRAAGI